MLCICEIHQLFFCITIAITCYIWCHKGKVLKENVSQLSWLHILMCDTLQALYLCMYLRPTIVNYLLPILLRPWNPSIHAGRWVVIIVLQHQMCQTNSRTSYNSYNSMKQVKIFAGLVLFCWLWHWGNDVVTFSRCTYVLNNMSR